jgi:type IV secretion system protein VirB10
MSLSVSLAWNRRIFPNGSTLELGGMEDTDSSGEAGFSGQVNNHYARIFGSAILMTTFGVEPS